METELPASPAEQNDESQPVQWQTPDFEETTVNCEVAAYFSGDMATENEP